MRRRALTTAGVAEAWYRLANPVDGGEAFTVATAHPNWRMAHPRVGELLVVADATHAFADSSSAPPMAGDHGGPAASAIPILITGGDPRIRAQVIAQGEAIPVAENPDIGVTAAWLLNITPPRSLTAAFPTNSPPLVGRVLHEAFVADDAGTPTKAGGHPDGGPR
jgi:hypothetical protein